MYKINNYSVLNRVVCFLSIYPLTTRSNCAIVVRQPLTTTMLFSAEGGIVKVGFIGLGIMGTWMAKHLLKSGYHLTVYNRTDYKADGLQGEGADVASSPRELAKACDVVCLCVTDGDVVEKILFDSEDSLCKGAHPGLVVIDLSTIAPDDTRRIALELGRQGVDMLDAPVSGGDVGARDGTLTIMVGGKKETFELMLPILGCFGRNITYMGESGAGQTTKLCNQVMCAVVTMAVAEAIALCRAAGVDPGAMIRVTETGSASSWILSKLGPKMIAGELDPGFRVNLMEKDLRLVAALSQSTGIDAPAAALALKTFNLISESEEGRELGTQALILAYTREEDGA